MIRALPLFLPAQNLRPLSRLSQWSALARQRRALANLDEAALKDIGLSQKQAQSEASRRFWDAPDNWRI